MLYERGLRASLVMFTGTLVCSICSGVQANIATLTHGNSVAMIDPDSQAGMFNWTVDGKSVLAQQWFWYRIGSTGPESGLNALATPVVNTFLGTRGVDITYAGSNGLTVQATYLLTGGSAGSGKSDIAETIRLENTSSQAMTLSFFQYSDFNLSAADTVSLANANKWVQTGGGSALSETTAIPDATRYEANLYNSTLASLTNGTTTTLSNTSVAGPGNVTWAWQWDITLEAGGSYLISKDKQVSPAVPAPGAPVLCFIGLTLVGAVRRRVA